MRVQFSSLARQDIDGTFSYINNILHNPTAAHNTVAGIINISLRLSEFPKLGTVLPLSNSDNIEIRYIISGNYLIAYMIKPAHLEIIRVLYARSDYLKLLDA